ncbi:7379_t:CDS:2 [Acaulospora colombiana]|uniref:7379_t:CDS:1 n=1 Tax=Acaulospora colombiana TaxID=27376 RepID=A0ACA9KF01_9GLOM|nr:7379_t:CDS:2 [Acaulospora colombiana]
MSRDITAFIAYVILYLKFHSNMAIHAETAKLIKNFFSSSHYVVVGASSIPSKYGNKVLKWYINNNYSVTPVNPNEDEIDGLKCVPNLSSIPNIDPKNISVSVITPPKVSKKILEEAAEWRTLCSSQWV